MDTADMVRGEGEWKNMQEIVRRTLKVCFDQLSKQGEQINQLVGQVKSLKSVLTDKVGRDEFNSHSDRFYQSNHKSNFAKSEFDKLNDIINRMKKDLERKASVRYVDDCLRLKLDRGDAIVRNLSSFSAEQYSSQLVQLYNDMCEAKLSIDILSKSSSKENQTNNSNSNLDYYTIKNQIDTIYQSMSDYYTKSHINALLDQKVNYDKIYIHLEIMYNIFVSTLSLACTAKCIKFRIGTNE